MASEDIFAALSQFMHAAGSEATKMVSVAAVGAPVTGREVVAKFSPDLLHITVSFTSQPFFVHNSVKS